MIKQTLIFLLFSIGLVRAQYPFKKDGKWGMIDDSIKVALTPQYDTLGFYQNGLVLAGLNKHFYLLDSTFETVSPKCLKIIPLDTNLYYGENNIEGFVFNQQGEVFLKSLDKKAPIKTQSGIIVYKNNKKGFVNYDNELILPIIYDGICERNNALQVVKDQVGWMDIDGKQIVPCLFENVQPFTERTFLVEEKGLLGLFSIEGHKVLPCEYSSIKKLNEFFAIASKGKGYLLYDLKKEVLVTQKSYEKYIVEMDGEYKRRKIFVYENYGLGLLDTLGNLLVEPKYHEIQSSNSEYFYVYKNNKVGIYKSKEREVIPPKYKNVSIYENAFVVDSSYTLNKQVVIRQGMFDINGRQIAPAKYDYLKRRTSGMIISQLGFEYGIYNQEGKEVFTPQFHEISAFENGIAMARKGLKWGVITDEGDASEFKYTQFAQFDDLIKLYNEEGLTMIYIENGKITGKDELPGIKTVFLNNKIRTPSFTRPSPRDSIKEENTTSYSNWFFDVYSGYYGKKDNATNSFVLSPIYDGYELFPMESFSMVWKEVSPSIVKFSGVELIYDRVYGIVDEGLDREAHGMDIVAYKKIIVNGAKMTLALNQKGVLELINPYGRVIVDDFLRFSTKNKSYQNYEKGIGLVFDEDGVDRFVDVLFSKGLNLKLAQNETLKNLLVNENKVSFEKILQGAFNSRKFAKLCQESPVLNSGNETHAQMTEYNHKNLWSVMGNNRNVFKKGYFENIDVYPLQEDVLIVKKYAPKSGLLNSKGEVIIPEMYDFINLPKEEMVLYINEGKCGFVGLNGNADITPIYYKAQDFNEGLAAVLLQGGWGYINKKGELKLPNVYNNARSFHQGLAAVKDKGLWGFINYSGEWVIAPKYTKVLKDFEQGIALIENNGKKGIIDTLGNNVVMPVYKAIKKMDDFTFKLESVLGTALFFVTSKTHSLPVYEKVKQYGEFICAYKGKQVVVFHQGKEIKTLKNTKVYRNGDERYLIIYKNRKWGVIDVLGNEIILDQYRLFHYDASGTVQQIKGAFVRKDKDRKEVYSTKDKWVFSNRAYSVYRNKDKKYDLYRHDGEKLLNSTEEIIPLENQLIAVKRNGRFLLYDSAIQSFLGTGFDQFKEANKSSIIVARRFSEGAETINTIVNIPCKYEKIIPVSADLYFVKQNNVYGYINRKGDVMWALSD